MEDVEKWKHKLLASERNGAFGVRESEEYLAFVRAHPQARVPTLVYKAGFALLLHKNIQPHHTPAGFGDEGT